MILVTLHPLFCCFSLTVVCRFSHLHPHTPPLLPFLPFSLQTDLEEDIVRALEEVEAQYAAAEEGEEGQQIEGEQMEGQGEEAEL